jgi:Cdc6-like AAA superfamily ATPase
MNNSNEFNDITRENVTNNQTMPSVPDLDLNDSSQHKDTKTSTESAKKVVEFAEEINVTIKGNQPVLVLFGAKGSGKTMTLVRLVRYLKENDYVVTPNNTFRNSKSEAYENACQIFMDSIYSENAAESTKAIDFLLLDVSKKGGGPLICHILEAPGEHYFDASNPSKPFLPYLINIKQNRNYPKIWLFIIEIGAWSDRNICAKYANKVAQMSSGHNSKDKVIVMCHKSDEQEKKGLMHRNNLPVYKEFFAALERDYKEILDSNKNTHPITSIWRKYNFDFEVFTAGSFTVSPRSGKKTYTPSDDIYPRRLWNIVKKAIYGSWF